MGARIRRVMLRCVAALALGFSSAASAVTITYQVTDLPDVVAGEDLWKYSYTVSGSFGAFGGFNILFTPTLYKSLENPPPAVNGDWLVSTTEPDAGLPADGLYSATALVSNPSLADPFTVSFVWLGRGNPGAQPFEVFDDTFAVLEIGQTQLPGPAQAPLPGTAALLCLGLLGLRVRGTQVFHQSLPGRSPGSRSIPTARWCWPLAMAPCAVTRATIRPTKAGNGCAAENEIVCVTSRC